MRILVALVAMTMAGQAQAAEKARMAVFDFSLIDTSPAPPTTEELDRLRLLDGKLQTALAERYAVVKAPTPPGANSIRGCNGCELDVARSLGTQQVTYGWVQKVSNLILNINLVIEDAQTGKVLRADSVDIRSNTDDSWSRGLRFLLNERLFRDD